MSKNEPTKARFPGGDVAPLTGELRIAIDKKPYAAIIGHAVVEPEVEVCGVLVGRVQRDAHGDFLHIDAAIRGESARQEGAQVTFTHETWNHIHSEMDQHHADREIVGWYHTHGGFGIFLSDMDMFIQKNFFSAPHQVAYVFDPLAGSEGFFYSKGDKLELATRYWLGGRERKVVSGSPASTSDDSPSDQLANAVTALQRTAASLHAATISRQSEGTPLWLFAVVGVGALAVAYTLFVRNDPVPATTADGVAPLLVIGQNGEHALGLELREVRRANDVYYVDGSGRHYVGIDARGVAATGLLDGMVPPGTPSLQDRQSPPPVPSAVLRQKPRVVERDAGFSSRNMWLLAGSALLALCAAVALVWTRRAARRTKR